MTIETLFVTKLYRARPKLGALRAELAHAMQVIARDDKAGQAWCAEKGYPGYTSYASLNDLTWRSPAFASLAEHLDEHAGLFARELDFDLGAKKLVLDSLWINILEPGGVHTGHIHPHSVLSGTFYVETPEGAGDDGRAAAKGARRAGPAAVPLCPSARRRSFAVGELAAARSGAQWRRNRAAEHQF
jgi:uncharacterized protein (TIGR02466 family)